MDYYQIVTGVIMAFLTGLVSYLFKSIGDKSSQIRKNTEDISVLKNTSVTDEKVRLIVKEEFEPQKNMLTSIMKKVDEIGNHVSEEKGYKRALREIEERNRREL